MSNSVHLYAITGDTEIVYNPNPMSCKALYTNLAMQLGLEFISRKCKQDCILVFYIPDSSNIPPQICY